MIGLLPADGVAVLVKLRPTADPVSVFQVQTCPKFRLLIVFAAVAAVMPDRGTDDATPVELIVTTPVPEVVPVDEIVMFVPATICVTPPDAPERLEELRDGADWITGYNSDIAMRTDFAVVWSALASTI
jgi:hypothetical protein